MTKVIEAVNYVQCNILNVQYKEEAKASSHNNSKFNTRDNGPAESVQCSWLYLLSGSRRAVRHSKHDYSLTNTLQALSRSTFKTQMMCAGLWQCVIFAHHLPVNYELCFMVFSMYFYRYLVLKSGLMLVLVLVIILYKCGMGASTIYLIKEFIH